MHAALTLMVVGVAAATYETKWFQQSLTHAKGDDRVFPQRFLVNDTFWGKGSAGLRSDKCPGPILFYSGNEGPITEFWPVNGFMTDRLAPKWGALLVMAEARYYGESLPLGNASLEPANLRWLSTELILADYVALLTALKASDPRAARCPVVSFGGSYGGTLTTFLRARYPEVVVGGLAASAPVGYYDAARWAEFGVDELTWSKIVAADYEGLEGCGSAVRGAIGAVSRATTAALVGAFRVCDASALGSDDDPAELFQYALESAPQGEYPPQWPLEAVCAALVAAEAEPDAEVALISVAGKFTSNFLGLGAEGCLEALEEGPGGVPGDGPGPDAWGYQSCTQTLHQFSSESLVRDYVFDLKAQNARCESLFGVVPNTTELSARYGGYDLPKTATNLIWSNGLLDPWHGGGFLPEHFPDAHPSNTFCVMPRGSHHTDLRADDQDDPPQVTACRDLEERTIRSWIDAYFQTNDH